MTLEMTTFGVQSDDVADNAAAVGWIQAVHLGFLESIAQPETLKFLLRSARADNSRFRAVYDPANNLRDPMEPVGTMLSYPGTLGTGDELLRIGCITAVTTRSTHRRRGILRQMMTAELSELAQAGVAVAALTVSEGGIYRRFGFGPAVPMRSVKLRTDTAFALRQDPPGRVEIVSAATYAEYLPTIFEAVQRSSAGTVSRGAMPTAELDGSFDSESQGPNRKTRHALYLDDDAVTGALCWEVSEAGVAKVRDFVAPRGGAELALWNFLAHIDLVTTVERGLVRIDDPLPLALVEPDVYTATRTNAHLWLRILDLPAALQSRSYDVDGQVILNVDDDLGYAAGTFRLRVTGGTATVTECAAEDADTIDHVSLDVAALGSALLGGVSVSTLADAGLAFGSGVATLGRLLRTAQAPVSLTPF